MTGSEATVKIPVPRIVAEIGCNHRGEFDTAVESIRTAVAFCKVDVVKFQKRTPSEVLTPEEYAAPHPNPAAAYGVTYGEHRERLEFDLGQHRRLKELAEEMGSTYATSVWDMTSTREIVSLDPVFIKIPSACNLVTSMIEYLCGEYGGELHISLGMTTRSEEEDLLRLLDDRGRGKDTVLYACSSGYPVPFEDVALLEIPRLKASYGSMIKEIGFSGHHLGIAVDIAALALGAVWFERHFTMDRTWKGTDHAASLEPDGMRRLCRDLRAVSLALTPKVEEILPIEQQQRAKLKRFPGPRG